MEVQQQVALEGMDPVQSKVEVVLLEVLSILPIHSNRRIGNHVIAELADEVHRKMIFSPENLVYFGNKAIGDSTLRNIVRPDNFPWILGWQCDSRLKIRVGDNRRQQVHGNRIEPAWI